MPDVNDQALEVLVRGIGAIARGEGVSRETAFGKNEVINEFCGWSPTAKGILEDFNVEGIHLITHEGEMVEIKKKSARG